MPTSGGFRARRGLKGAAVKPLQLGTSFDCRKQEFARAADHAAQQRSRALDRIAALLDHTRDVLGFEQEVERVESAERRLQAIWRGDPRVLRRLLRITRGSARKATSL
jgi:hypothetical protein